MKCADAFSAFCAKAARQYKRACRQRFRRWGLRVEGVVDSGFHGSDKRRVAEFPRWW